MARPAQFAVLLNAITRPPVEQLKHAFRTFQNLTDADAIRLAAGAHGVLLRHASRDAARAFQSALQAAGIAATVVSEANLPALPPGIALHRLQFLTEALIIFDQLGRAKPMPWPRLGLIAAADVRHFELTKMHAERDGTKARPWENGAGEVAHKVASDSQLVLELMLADGSTRFQIAATEFPFKYVINRPRLSTEAKFVWLVREICRRAPGALLNHGAQALRDGAESVPEYMNPQMLADEMVWLLWHATQPVRATPQ